MKIYCPQAYNVGPKIFCKALGGLCGHVRFRRCKGWWELSEQARTCPKRGDDDEDERME